MLSYCLKCRKNTEMKNPEIARSKNRRIMLLSRCAVCDSKNSKFPKEEEAEGLLSSCALKAHLSQNHLSASLLFQSIKLVQ